MAVVAGLAVAADVEADYWLGWQWWLAWLAMVAGLAWQLIGWAGVAADLTIDVIADCSWAGSSGWSDVAAGSWLGW